MRSWPSGVKNGLIKVIGQFFCVGWYWLWESNRGHGQLKSTTGDWYLCVETFFDLLFVMDRERLAWSLWWWVKNSRRIRLDVLNALYISHYTWFKRSWKFPPCDLGQKIKTLQVFETSSIYNLLLNAKHKWWALCCIENSPKSVDLAWCGLQRRWSQQTWRHHKPTFWASGVCVSSQRQR